MKTLRIAALTSMFAALGLMTGCDLFGTNSDSSAPEITSLESANFDDANNTWAAGDSIEFYGKATDDNSIVEIKLEVLNSSNTAVATYTKVTASSSLTFGKTGSDYLFTNSGFIKNPGTWVAGSYTVKITVKDNDGLTATKSLTLAKVAGTGTVVTPVNLTKESDADLGAQGATAGSFLSIEGGWSITSGAKTAADEDSIDVVFFADGSTAAVPYFLSPAKAVELNLGSLSGWTTKHNTIIVASTTALTTVDQVKALTDGATTHSAKVVSGSWYAIKLDNGKYGAIQVKTFSDAGRSSTVTVTVFN